MCPDRGDVGRCTLDAVNRDVFTWCDALSKIGAGAPFVAFNADEPGLLSDSFKDEGLSLIHI